MRGHLLSHLSGSLQPVTALLWMIPQRMKPEMLSLVFCTAGEHKNRALVTPPPSSLYCHLGPWWRVQPGVNTDFTRRGRKLCRTAPFLLQAAQLAVSRHDEMFSPTDIMPPSSESWRHAPVPRETAIWGENSHTWQHRTRTKARAPRWHPHITLWSGSLSTYRSVTAWAALVPAALSLVGLTCQSRQTALPLYLRAAHGKALSADFLVC